jgi:hypothetical protein
MKTKRIMAGSSLKDLGASPHHTASPDDEAPKDMSRSARAWRSQRARASYLAAELAELQRKHDAGELDAYGRDLEELPSGFLLTDRSYTSNGLSAAGDLDDDQAWQVHVQSLPPQAFTEIDRRRLGFVGWEG